MSEQEENIERVSKRIGKQIIAFFAQRRPGTIFHAEDLRRHIRLTVGEVAPGSPDRIMRDLRQRRIIDYILISRKDSEYRVLGEMVQQELFASS